MKLCPKCGIEKNKSEFYKDKRCKDGLYSICKKCHSLLTIKNNKKYIKTEENKIYQRNYHKIYRKKYRKIHRKEINKCKRNWEKNNKDRIRKLNSTPERIIMNRVRSYTVSRINLKGKHCEICGKNKTLQRHHINYNKPMEIMILCAQCHSDWHKENKPIYPIIN